VLKGLPAVNYSARDIVYRPRNVRAHRVYGFSPVQQVLMTVNIALRRQLWQLWQLDYLTEGSILDALIGVPQGWTPDQIKQFQDYWDTEFAGDLAKRRRAKFVPGETAAKVVQTKEPQHKDDFDEWLARIICFAFSVPPQWATKAMNRATADNQSAQAEEEGLEPTKEWVKDLIDEIVAEEFSSPDLELHWLDEDEGDPETVLEGRVKLGAVTLNEMRDALGLDPFDNAAADRPMVLTATGFVPIEANVGGQGADASRAGTNGQNASAKRQSAKLVLLKASPDDPEHSGWPAGAAGGKGGKFRPKDTATDFISPVTPIPVIDFSRGFHEAVVNHWMAYLKSIGIPAIKEPAVHMIGLPEDILGYPDIMAIMPGMEPSVLEIKTGEEPITLTLNQTIYLPMMQLGWHVYSNDLRVTELGWEPGTPFPPMRVFFIRAPGPGKEYSVAELPSIRLLRGSKPAR
jgi:hypothetical protein